MLDDAIRSFEDLREHIGEPRQAVLDKQLDHLDRHCRDFIGRSPIALLATADADGRCDCSPRGGPPGFAHVLDERRLAIPDYTGNRRQDSHVNLLENPHVGLLFLLPGMGETLRVNGRGTLTRDAELLERLLTGGTKPPRLALQVEVDEAFLHCPKAFVRSGVWDPSTWTPPDELPSAAEIYRDHRDTPGLTVEQTRAELAESVRERLW
jgi:PPOX class probable FMN-dependent enzyme